MMQFNEKTVEAAAVAIQAHENHLLLEGDTELQIWHLLLSLHEFCAARGYDFEKIDGEVKEALASGDIHAPAWEAQEKARRRAEDAAKVASRM